MHNWLPSSQGSPHSSDDEGRKNAASVALCFILLVAFFSFMLYGCASVAPTPTSGSSDPQVIRDHPTVNYPRIR